MIKSPYMVTGHEKQPSILSSGKETAKITPLGALVDEMALKREKGYLYETAQTELGWIESSHAFISLDKTSFSAWENLEKRNFDLAKAGISLKRKIKQSKEGTSLNAIDLLSLFLCAQQCLMLETTERQQKFSKKHGLPAASITAYFQARKFIETEQLSLKIGHISLLELLTGDSPSSSVYESFIEAIAFKKAKTYSKTSVKNHSPLSEKYPNKAILNADSACEQLLALNAFTPHFLEDQLKRFSIYPIDETEREIVAKAKEIAKQMFSIKSILLETILDPKSPDFLNLKHAVLKDLNSQDEQKKTLVLFALGLNNTATIPYIYRFVKEEAEKEEEDSAFYALFAASIEDYARTDLFTSAGLLTNDDVSMLVRTDLEQDDAIVSPDAQKIKRSNLQKLSGKKICLRDNDINNIRWGQLVPPESLEVESPEKGKTNGFIINFHYQNENGEALSFSLIVDLQTFKYDWTLLESPNDPRMKDLNNAVFPTIEPIFLEALKKVEMAEAEIKTSKKPNDFPKSQAKHGCSTQAIKHHIPVPKEKKKKQTKPLSPVDEILQSPIGSPTETNHLGKKHIEVPEEKELNKLLESLAFEDRELAKRAIELFNQPNQNDNGQGGNNGKLKMLTSLSPTGQRLFSLRFGCRHAHAGARVLMEEIPGANDDGIRHLRIADIRYRKDIYKKHRI